MKAAQLRTRGPSRDRRHATEVPSAAAGVACSSGSAIRPEPVEPSVDQAARRAFGADCEALTAVLVTAWKLASATSAACLAALWALS